MRVELLSYTPLSEELCAMAANGCYSSLPAYDIELDEKQIEKILKNTNESGHHSVLEHAYFTFSISGVSRALTHQLVRHRIASFSQQSQRYVSMDRAMYVIPESIDKNEEARRRYVWLMNQIWAVYGELQAMEIPNEDARYVLPNACTTNIVVTMNIRELLHLFELRCCNKAQWEIRELAWKMLAICEEKAPLVFKQAGPRCRTTGCIESKPCGNSPYTHSI